MDNPIDIANEQLRYRKFPEGDIFKYAAEKDCENWGLCHKRTQIIAFMILLIMVFLISIIVKKKKNYISCDTCGEYISNCICNSAFSYY
jgi:hypothetical protein